MSSDYVYTMYRVDKFYGAGPAGAGEHLALVPARREDRRARPERRRQVDAPADHGGQGGAVVRRRGARARRDRRPARAGAGARPGEGRARQRRGRRPRRCATCSTASTRSRAAFAEPDADYDALLAEQAKVQDAIDRADAWQLDDRLDHAMDALRAAGGRPRRRRRSPAASAAASRSAGCCSRRPTCCCSTSRRTTSTPSRSLWLERFLADYKGTVVAVTHDRYFLDNVAGWILELDRGQASRSRATTRRGSSRSRSGSRIEEKKESARQRTLARELEWVRMSPRARHAKSKARLGAYEQLLAEEQNVKLDRSRSTSRRARGSATS